MARSTYTNRAINTLRKVFKKQNPGDYRKGDSFDEATNKLVAKLENQNPNDPRGPDDLVRFLAAQIEDMEQKQIFADTKEKDLFVKSLVEGFSLNETQPDENETQLHKLVHQLLEKESYYDNPLRSSSLYTRFFVYECKENLTPNQNPIEIPKQTQEHFRAGLSQAIADANKTSKPETVINTILVSLLSEYPNTVRVNPFDIGPIKAKAAATATNTEQPVAPANVTVKPGVSVRAYLKEGSTKTPVVEEKPAPVDLVQLRAEQQQLKATLMEALKNSDQIKDKRVLNQSPDLEEMALNNLDVANALLNDSKNFNNFCNLLQKQLSEKQLSSEDKSIDPINKPVDSVGKHIAEIIEKHGESFFISPELAITISDTAGGYQLLSALSLKQQQRVNDVNSGKTIPKTPDDIKKLGPNLSIMAMQDVRVANLIGNSNSNYLGAFIETIGSPEVSKIVNHHVEKKTRGFNSNADHIQLYLKPELASKIAAGKTAGILWGLTSSKSGAKKAEAIEQFVMEGNQLSDLDIELRKSSPSSSLIELAQTHPEVANLLSNSTAYPQLKEIIPKEDIIKIIRANWDNSKFKMSPELKSEIFSDLKPTTNEVIKIDNLVARHLEEELRETHNSTPKESNLKSIDDMIESSVNMVSLPQNFAATIATPVATPINKETTEQEKTLAQWERLKTEKVGTYNIKQFEKLLAETKQHLTDKNTPVNIQNSLRLQATEIEGKIEAFSKYKAATDKAQNRLALLFAYREMGDVAKAPDLTRTLSLVLKDLSTLGFDLTTPITAEDESAETLSKDVLEGPLAKYRGQFTPDKFSSIEPSDLEAINSLFDNPENKISEERVFTEILLMKQEYEEMQESKDKAKNEVSETLSSSPLNALNKAWQAEYASKETKEKKTTINLGPEEEKVITIREGKEKGTKATTFKGVEEIKEVQTEAYFASEEDRANRKRSYRNPLENSELNASTATKEPTKDILKPSPPKEATQQLAEKIQAAVQASEKANVQEKTVSELISDASRETLRTLPAELENPQYQNTPHLQRLAGVIQRELTTKEKTFFAEISLRRLEQNTADVDAIIEEVEANDALAEFAQKLDKTKHSDVYEKILGKASYDVFCIDGDDTLFFRDKDGKMQFNQHLIDQAVALQKQNPKLQVVLFTTFKADTLLGTNYPRHKMYDKLVTDSKLNNVHVCIVNSPHYESQSAKFSPAAEKRGYGTMEFGAFAKQMENREKIILALEHDFLGKNENGAIIDEKENIAFRGLLTNMQPTINAKLIAAARAKKNPEEANVSNLFNRKLFDSALKDFKKEKAQKSLVEKYRLKDDIQANRLFDIFYLWAEAQQLEEPYKFLTVANQQANIKGKKPKVEEFLNKEKVEDINANDALSSVWYEDFYTDDTGRLLSAKAAGNYGSEKGQMAEHVRNYVGALTKCPASEVRMLQADDKTSILETGAYCGFPTGLLLTDAKSGNVKNIPFHGNRKSGITAFYEKLATAANPEQQAAINSLSLHIAKEQTLGNSELTENPQAIFQRWEKMNPDEYKTLVSHQTTRAAIQLFLNQQLDSVSIAAPAMANSADQGELPPLPAEASATEIARDAMLREQAHAQQKNVSVGQTEKTLATFSAVENAIVNDNLAALDTELKKTGTNLKTIAMNDPEIAHLLLNNPANLRKFCTFLETQLPAEAPRGLVGKDVAEIIKKHSHARGDKPFIVTSNLAAEILNTGDSVGKKYGLHRSFTESERIELATISRLKTDFSITTPQTEQRLMNTYDKKIVPLMSTTPSANTLTAFPLETDNAKPALPGATKTELLNYLKELDEYLSTAPEKNPFLDGSRERVRNYLVSHGVKIDDDVKFVEMRAHGDLENQPAKQSAEDSNLSWEKIRPAAPVAKVVTPPQPIPPSPKVDEEKQMRILSIEKAMSNQEDARSLIVEHPELLKGAPFPQVAKIILRLKDDSMHHPNIIRALGTTGILTPSAGKGFMNSTGDYEVAAKTFLIESAQNNPDVAAACIENPKMLVGVPPSQVAPIILQLKNNPQAQEKIIPALNTAGIFAPDIMRNNSEVATFFNSNPTITEQLMPMAGAITKAKAELLNQMRHNATQLVDDKLTGAQKATIVEACARTGNLGALQTALQALMPHPTDLKKLAMENREIGQLLNNPTLIGSFEKVLDEKDIAEIKARYASAPKSAPAAAQQQPAKPANKLPAESIKIPKEEATTKISFYDFLKESFRAAKEKTQSNPDASFKKEASPKTVMQHIQQEVGLRGFIVGLVISAGRIAGSFSKPKGAVTFEMEEINNTTNNTPAQPVTEEIGTVSNAFTVSGNEIEMDEIKPSPLNESTNSLTPPSTTPIQPDKERDNAQKYIAEYDRLERVFEDLDKRTHPKIQKADISDIVKFVKDVSTLRSQLEANQYIWKSDKPKMEAKLFGYLETVKHKIEGYEEDKRSKTSSLETAIEKAKKAAEKLKDAPPKQEQIEELKEEVAAAIEKGSPKLKNN